MAERRSFTWTWGHRSRHEPVRSRLLTARSPGEGRQRLDRPADPEVMERGMPPGTGQSSTMMRAQHTHTPGPKVQGRRRRGRWYHRMGKDRRRVARRRRSVQTKQQQQQVQVPRAEASRRRSAATRRGGGVASRTEQQPPRWQSERRGGAGGCRRLAPPGRAFGSKRGRCRWKNDESRRACDGRRERVASRRRPAATLATRRRPEADWSGKPPRWQPERRGGAGGCCRLAPPGRVSWQQARPPPHQRRRLVP